jgi:uncharacterized protein with NRDE domain
MCLAAWAIDQTRTFPLVLVANRDEYFDRPAARLAWWQERPEHPPILGGRDLQQGGTWFGLSTAGRLALVTNIRSARPPDPEAPSRGRLVADWLSGQRAADPFWMQAALSGYNGFNLLAADFAAGECFWASNGGSLPRRLTKGLYGLSNAQLDTPWPKVGLLKQRLADALATHADVDALASTLFGALADRQTFPDEQLPATGVPLELERMLSAAFIRSPDGHYGTRTSTVLITHRRGRRLFTHVFERTFTAGPGLALLRRSTLPDWPPRYEPGLVPKPLPPSEVLDDVSLAETPAAPVRLVPGRARGLLRPLKPSR